MKNHTSKTYILAIYAVLALMSLLSLACGGFGAASTSPPPRIDLTPPLPSTMSLPVAIPATSPPQPTPQPAGALAPVPPTPQPAGALTPVPPTSTPAPAPGRANRLIPYAQIAAGRHHACGLRADGVAHCWGNNSNGETNVPSRMLFRQISAGRYFTCGLRYEGTITCWGRNARGQTDAPQGSFTQIAAGLEHACALDSDGVAVCWGSIIDTPTGDYAFTAIGSGPFYSCGLTTAGDLHCWGSYKIKETGPFQALAVGVDHICVLRLDGAPACYGQNWYYQSAPLPETAFTQIAAGSNHSCGITLDGVLECWGSGVKARPALRLDAPSGVFTAVSISWKNNCGLRTDGTAQCWRQPNPARVALPTANLVAAFNGRIFERPIELFSWPSGGLAVVELSGSIKAHDASDKDNAEPHLILDLTDLVVTGHERGMVSAALDPNFDQFPFLYVYYIAKIGPDQQIQGRLSRFPVVNGVAVRSEELVVLNMSQPAIFHLGGAIRFGPDGMLYLGLGDNAKMENAQNLASRNGKIIRIDVRGATPEQPYRIPNDNPFTERPDAQPEIWAYGLRNPWRMDFDADGNLWVADVSIANDEEVSIATAGANLGWPIFQGNLCLKTASDCAALSSATTPAITYSREQGCAIIGGVGSPRPDIPYIFGDYCTGLIWAVERDDTAPTGWRRREIADANNKILAFGTDASGTVFVLLNKSPILRMTW